MFEIEKKTVEQDFEVEQERCRIFIESYLLSFPEAVERSQISSDRFEKLIKEGEIEPFIQKRGCTLFHYADVDRIRNKQKRSSFRLLDERKGSTRHSLAYFDDHINQLEEIDQIFIYFYEQDACMDGFYIPHRDLKPKGDFQWLESPTMVLRDVKGQEMWIYGCNCGYGGEGPHGSESVLKHLGMEEDLIKYVFRHKVVKFFRKQDGSWEVFAHDGEYGGNLYLFHNKLSMSVTFEDPLDLRWTLRFIPKPAKIVLLEDYKEAEEKGWLPPRTSFDAYKWYPIVTFDESGRSIFVRTEHESEIVDHIPLILDLFGFEVESLNGSPWAKLQDTIQAVKRIWGSSVRIKGCETRYEEPPDGSWSIFDQD